MLIIYLSNCNLIKNIFKNNLSNNILYDMKIYEMEDRS